ncbi:MAG: hypothetical protein JSU06_04280 [Actinobacteria bacterium]|nr:hypothetical protein [Actinomycetota bacterium]
MRFRVNRRKNRGRPRAPRIAISVEEITADLNYHGEPRRPGAVTPVGRGRR